MRKKLTFVTINITEELHEEIRGTTRDMYKWSFLAQPKA
jgi:hypothetical protein